MGKVQMALNTFQPISQIRCFPREAAVIKVVPGITGITGDVLAKETMKQAMM